MTTDDIMALANKYAASNGKALLETLYGTSRSYTEQCTAEAFQDRQALRAAIEKAAAELRRLYFENEKLRSAPQPAKPAEQDSPWCMKMNDCKTKCEDCPDEVPQPAEQEPCGWQFFQDGQWYNGSDRHDHRKHTEAAGFPTRDVYPAPQPAKPAEQGSAAAGLSEELRHLLVAISEAIADQDDRAAQAILRGILAAPQPAKREPLTDEEICYPIHQRP